MLLLGCCCLDVVLEMLLLEDVVVRMLLDVVVRVLLLGCCWDVVRILLLLGCC